MDYIIYHGKTEHTDCPDGVVAAAIAGLAHPTAKFMRDTYRDIAEYGDIPHPAEKYPFTEGDHLIIVDFSFPAKWLHYWESQGISVTVIDHHERKFGMLQGFSGAVLDASECGATLTWRHFFPDMEPPDYFIHLKRRDIGIDGYYEGECRESEEFNEGLGSIRHALKPGADSTAVIRFLQQFITQDVSGIDLICTIGKPVVAERDRLIQEAMKRATLVTLKGYTCGYLETKPHENRLGSQIGHELAKLPGAAFGWVKTSNGRSELRGNGTVDVGAIAESLGGGGHPNASGFSRDIQPVQKNVQKNNDAEELVKAIAARHEWRDRLAGSVSVYGGEKFPVVKLSEDGSEDRYVSDVCSYLNKTLKPAPAFCACITSTGEWSLRSDRNGSNVDVGAIAKEMGGSGHRNEAEFKPK